MPFPLTDQPHLGHPAVRRQSPDDHRHRRFIGDQTEGLLFLLLLLSSTEDAALRKKARKSGELPIRRHRRRPLIASYSDRLPRIQAEMVVGLEPLCIRRRRHCIILGTATLHPTPPPTPHCNLFKIHNSRINFNALRLFPIIVKMTRNWRAHMTASSQNSVTGPGNVLENY